jgi:eukaryotic-like serine/threonine-protein kinase
MIGESLGIYKIVDLIGEGGMGVVYQAEHTLIGRRVAIKRLLPEFTRDAEVVDRFMNEARAAARIQHPGLCEVFDFGHHTDGSAYIVMELLEGESLAARIEREARIYIATALAIARQVASALHAAHEQGIVHRDLKPENIFLIPDRDAPGGVRTKVLDFGIAKLALSEDQRSVKTKTGVVFGTPRYMAPEQCRNATNVDRRADIYGLGCILYEMLVGHPPYQYDSWAELVAAHMFEAPPKPSEENRRVAPEVEDIVVCAMAKQPDDRFPTMMEFADALELSWRATTSSEISAMFTPPAGVSVVPPSKPRTARRAEIAQTVPATAKRPPSRRALWVALGFAIVVGAGAGVYFGTGGAGETPVPMQLASHGDAGVDAPAAVAEVVPPIDASSATPRPDVDDRAPKAKEDKVRLSVTSVPSGADVYRAADGVRIGKTPLEKTFERTDGEIELLIKLTGYRDGRVVLSTVRDGEQTVKLVKLRATGTPPPSTERHPPAGGGSGTGSGATVLDPYKDP